jgi:magnesium transporter
VSRSKRKHSSEIKLGLPPGSAVYVGQPREGGVHVRAFCYDANAVQEYTHPVIPEVRALVGAGRVVWLDCDGVHDVELVRDVCERFGVHPLAMEDVLNTNTRTKIDVFEGGIVLLAVDMLTAEGAGGAVDLVTEHVSLLLGPGFVLSFQEGRSGDLFDPVRQRIRSGTGKIRSMGPDYLVHALVDAVVDGYLVVVSRLEDRIDRSEAEALDVKTIDLPHRVYGLKTELGGIRRSVLPLREAVGRMQRGEVPHVGKAVEPYFRDLADHVAQVMDIVESDRDRLNGVVELHLAIQTHRMNDVMKVLTIVATIFIPLSWIAGVYGMNFDYMPELRVWWAYPVTVAGMIGIGVGMLGWFRYRGWI